MRWMNQHPNLTTWFVLAVGMLIALGWSAREEELAAMQWVWLAIAVASVAGLCAWIISWEADYEEGDPWQEAETDTDGDNVSKSVPEGERT